VPVAVGLTADDRARRRRRHQGSKNEHHPEQGLDREARQMPHALENHVSASLPGSSGLAVQYRVLVTGGGIEGGNVDGRWVAWLPPASGSIVAEGAAVITW
jgi:hypothetical protein